jgi:hypothetical protein
MDKQTERLTKNTEINLQATGGQTGRQVDSQVYRRTDRKQAYRQTDK